MKGGSLCTHAMFTLSNWKLHSEGGDCCPFSADAFESKFQETLERGLLRLSAEHLIESSEINAWMEEYDFGGKKLREIVADDGNREVLEELIRRLTELKKHQEE